MNTTADPVILDLEPIERRPEPEANSPAVTDNSPAGMMLAAMRQGASLETVEKMMALQERWEANEARKAYNEAMACFKAEAIEIIKRKEVDFTNRTGNRTHYKHAELSDVVTAVGPALSRHGFSWSWSLKQDKAWIEVTCTLKHRLGHSESVSLGAPPDDSGGKNTIQSIVSAKTYLERHTLKAICGVAEKGADNDGGGDPKAKKTEIPPELLQAARDAAMGGWKALAKWIQSRSEAERKLLDPESDNLKAAAKEADAKGVAK